MVFRLCENEGVKMGLYRGERGVYGSAIEGGFGRGSGLNLNGEVGGVYDGWMWIGEGCMEKRLGFDR